MNTENDTATNSWHGASWSEADWHGANQRYLMAALADVREALKHHAAGAQGKAQETDEDTGERTDLGEISRTMPAPPALEVLCAAFGLSPFERDVLLLTAGPELDSGFARLCGAAQGNAARAHPTFSLALAALPDAHWSALTPAAPLRHWRLIEVATSPSDTTLMLSPLRMDEYVLHYLAGAPHLDERLAGMLKAVRPTGALVPSHRDLATQLAMTWSKASGLSRLPVVQLCGSEVVGKLLLVGPYSVCAGRSRCSFHRGGTRCPDSIVGARSGARRQRIVVELRVLGRCRYGAQLRTDTTDGECSQPTHCDDS
jgi:hypothetical protein